MENNEIYSSKIRLSKEGEGASTFYTVSPRRFGYVIDTTTNGSAIHLAELKTEHADRTGTATSGAENAPTPQRKGGSSAVNRLEQPELSCEYRISFHIDRPSLLR